MNTQTSQALTIALNSEYAAVFSYGVIAAYAAATRRDEIAAATAAHRALRDSLVSRLTAEKQPVADAAPGYTLPLIVDDPVSAIRAALAVEEQCSLTYRSLIEQADAPIDRRTGVDGLRDCALRGANWRLVLRISPATVAMPGAPG